MSSNLHKGRKANTLQLALRSELHAVFFCYA
nr:MAG TPA: hypothetical protein [Caudoviricetes sp.]